MSALSALQKPYYKEYSRQFFTQQISDLNSYSKTPVFDKQTTPDVIDKEFISKIDTEKLFRMAVSGLFERGPFQAVRTLEYLAGERQHSEAKEIITQAQQESGDILERVRKSLARARGESLIRQSNEKSNKTSQKRSKPDEPDQSTKQTINKTTPPTKKPKNSIEDD